MERGVRMNAFIHSFIYLFIYSLHEAGIVPINTQPIMQFCVTWVEVASCTSHFVICCSRSEVLPTWWLVSSKRKKTMKEGRSCRMGVAWKIWHDITRGWQLQFDMDFEVQGSNGFGVASGRRSSFLRRRRSRSGRRGVTGSVSRHWSFASWKVFSRENNFPLLLLTGFCRRQSAAPKEGQWCHRREVSSSQETNLAAWKKSKQPLRFSFQMLSFRLPLAVLTNKSNGIC